MYIHIWYTQELKVPWTFIPSFFFWPPRPNLKMTHFSFRFNIHSVSPHTDSRPLYFFASSLMTNLIFSSFYHCCCFFLVFLLTVVVQSCPQTIPDSHPHLHFLCYLKLTTVSHVAVTRRQVIRMQSCPLLQPNKRFLWTNNKGLYQHMWHHQMNREVGKVNNMHTWFCAKKYPWSLHPLRVEILEKHSCHAYLSYIVCFSKRRPLQVTMHIQRVSL